VALPLTIAQWLVELVEEMGELSAGETEALEEARERVNRAAETMQRTSEP
jgi:hypothetical protein